MLVLDTPSNQVVLYNYELEISRNLEIGELILSVMQNRKVISKNDLNKSRCSPEFQNFIDIANSLKAFTKNVFIPTRNEILAINKFPLPDKSIGYEVRSEIIIDLYKKYLSSYPKEVNEFVFNRKDEDFFGDELDRIEFRLSYLRSIEVGITALAHTEQTTYESGSNLIELWNQMLSDYSDQSADLTVRIYLDKDGFIRVYTNPFLQYIAENNIQANRIRLCETCSKIFWAKREESRACSPKCAVAFRQKRWRETNKEEYNQNRRLNYAYKKSVKNKKENKNGTL